MVETTFILIITAASLGFIHTLLGPDHYVPFIAMSKAGGWSRFKTLLITGLSGLGHVLSSVFLGLIGISAGIALNKIKAFESFRGDLAAWLIITFGLLYAAWGLRKAYSHKHEHDHETGKLTPWIIFTIFVLGPCEPLIPLLIYPSVTESVITMLLVVIVFAAVTISTMIGLVAAGIFGLNLVPPAFYEKYAHAFAGIMILFCGLAIKFAGL